MTVLSRAAIAAAMLAILSSAPASAQSGGGFFSGLFGQQKPKPITIVPAKPGKPLKLTPAAVPKTISVPKATAEGAKPALPPSATPSMGTPRPSYVTMCVRLCDGFYYPVSSPTRPANPRQDRDLCEQTCSVPAKLYIQYSPGGSAAQMRDLDGNPYKKLKTAFLYRKKLVPNCSCRAAPWSEAERARHDEYALHENTRRMMEELEAEMAAASAIELEDWQIEGEDELLDEATGIALEEHEPATKDGPNPPAVRVIALIPVKTENAKPQAEPMKPAIAVIKVAPAKPASLPQATAQAPAVPPQPTTQIAVLKATKTSPGGALAFKRKVLKDPRENSIR